MVSTRASKKEVKNSGQIDSSIVYDTLIIGGGITGATLLWDCSLRGIRALLVEKNDFASGTSQATSKLIHGGLRYLKNAEFGLVRESLRERRVLAKISPHAVRTLPFLIPIYSRMEKLVLRAGMQMYEMFSFDRNQDITEDAWIPKFRFLSRSEAMLEAGPIPREGLLGCYQYYDYQNINPERHTCEFLLSAKRKGGVAKNYSELVAISKEKEIYQSIILDKRTGKKIPVFSRSVVNAAGPWADSIESLLGIAMEKNLVRSKGIHIVTRSFGISKALVLKKKDKTHMFVLPWRGKTIIGTTDTAFEESPDHFKVTKKDIQELIEEFNFAFGNTSISEKDVDYFYGGMRPLVEDPGEPGNTYNASRKNEIIDHKSMGFPGFYTALGGKYTTSRALAEKIADKICEYLPGDFGNCETEYLPLVSGEYSDLKSLCSGLTKKFHKLSGERIESVATRYGSLAYEFLAEAKPEEIPAVLSNGEKVWPSEIRIIAKNEWIEKASDFFFRRSGIGTTGMISDASLQLIFEQLSQSLGWNTSRRNLEKAEVLARYKMHT
ncbi:glycerol-3-phosphate dehydrogenase [Leptospira perolatii]|uniref:Glycerol-3-phosphate dehydrogenase n=1 Tax=Leptospira perolatii TaxID=2023191 RepID=A0A2M9ZMQ7_9LEPT|nr:glycerol-3-phosphate dehydrogenase/oxidase [Leptospira perolatii]PJZ68279.1 glycerol-3-phosphate dehydrogenase [Leptospira perolatii]PJZ73370.1 glycerol-3-phosphate dehydrogenase [Leptospira perolatii]